MRYKTITILYLSTEEEIALRRMWLTMLNLDLLSKDQFRDIYRRGKVKISREK